MFFVWKKSVILKDQIIIGIRWALNFKEEMYLNL